MLKHLSTQSQLEKTMIYSLKCNITQPQKSSSAASRADPNPAVIQSLHFSHAVGFSSPLQKSRSIQIVLSHKLM